MRNKLLLRQSIRTLFDLQDSNGSGKVKVWLDMRSNRLTEYRKLVVLTIKLPQLPIPAGKYQL